MVESADMTENSELLKSKGTSGMLEEVQTEVLKHRESRVNSMLEFTTSKNLTIIIPTFVDVPKVTQHRSYQVHIISSAVERKLISLKSPE